MITYRIVQYRCTCKYIYFTVNSRPRKCPEHGKTQLSVTLWCDTCGNKLTVTPLSGRTKRCYQCNMYKQRKSINRRLQKSYNEKHDILELTDETLEEKDERHFNECFLEVEAKFKPPVVEKSLWLNI